ncbi:integrator complex subunit 15 isoform X2 [Hydra vulgaris]|uniref:Integrator complex subunit 15 isoform X2 n=1 Tax=Hydra vulgaris TaxID=6087 RepID=A0ABM4CD48_HYDVU
MMMSEFGENIWDISSWTSDVVWKDAHLHRYFDTLPFNECIKEVIDLAQTYFESIHHAYDDDEEGAVEPDFPYLDILVLITEEYLYGFFFQVVTPLQELQLLETLCRYFQESKLDPVRYLVFDCLFGLPGENLDLQIGILEHKMTLMCKLSSMAVGTACGNVLNCIAVWMHSYGSQLGRGARVAYFIVNDYCYICPKAIDAVKNVVNVSPVFAYQFIVALSHHYVDAKQDDDNDDLIPPASLVEILATWIIEQPNICSVKVPPVFLELPSIHKFVYSDNVKNFDLCPIFSYIEWCLLEPFLRHQTLSDVAIKKKSYSMLHYGFLKFMSSEKSISAMALNDSDGEIEPGELLEENDGVDLLKKSDVLFLLNVVKKSIQKYPDALEEHKQEAVDKLLQILQVAKWAGCYDFPPKQLIPYFVDLPKTKLLTLILSTW